MPSPEGGPRHIPEWAERERLSDLTWITENLHKLFPAAQLGVSTMGRGVLVIDTTTVIMHDQGDGNPMFYLPEAQVQELGNQDALRMVRAYDPSWQLVAGLLKPEGKESFYRVGVPTEGKNRPV